MNSLFDSRKFKTRKVSAAYDEDGKLQGKISDTTLGKNFWCNGWKCPTKISEWIKDFSDAIPRAFPEWIWKGSTVIQEKFNSRREIS